MFVSENPVPNVYKLGRFIVSGNFCTYLNAESPIVVIPSFKIILFKSPVQLYKLEVMNTVTFDVSIDLSFEQPAKALNPKYVRFCVFPIDSRLVQYSKLNLLLPLPPDTLVMLLKSIDFKFVQLLKYSLDILSIVVILVNYDNSLNVSIEVLSENKLVGKLVNDYTVVLVTPVPSPIPFAKMSRTALSSNHT